MSIFFYSHFLRIVGTTLLRVRRVVRDLKLDGDDVSFKFDVSFNDTQFTMEFKGKVDGKTLKSEFINPRGTRGATGKKID